MNHNDELPSQYIAETIEPAIRTLWEESSAFHADPSSDKPPYCIMMPPPNVTGVLHMGHALVNTLQDILIRWKKMSGFEVLWMPGTDHAGIATQTVVERHLMKTEGKRRTDYPRNVFLKHVWDWKEKSQSTILGQMKALGCAADWKRLRFTMDAGSNRAVRHMFKLLFDKGLIYRGDYLVNWDPVTETALADDEVEHEERQGALYTIRYPLHGSPHALCVATTRPETLLGDTAVAVHPKDERYKSFIGSYIDHPITGRQIPIVADDFVDQEFGTGVVKITPGHDPNDYQLALRHSLPMINILNPNGTLNEEGLHYQGMSVEEARQAIIEELKNKGFLVRIEPHVHRVGVSYRSKAVIEPKLSKQWFVKLSSFKDVLRKYVETKKVKIIPESWESTYYQWIDNLRDWCISRQLWWGHQIPIWYNKENREIVICYDGDGLPEEVKADPDAWEQESDVLDTWFSSALWPFSTLGWPEKTPELCRFYPNSTLITGHDILFFWVARMIMMGHFAMNDAPFSETFLHGLIYSKSYWRENPSGGISYVPEEERKDFDLGKREVPKEVKSRWEKMSKSKGNIIDPMEVLKEYGTDAMRLALASSATDARQIDLDRRRFEEWRNFANKVWNGARFVLMNISHEDFSQLQLEDMRDLALEDQWILSRVESIAASVSSSLEKYAFDKASQEAYDFYWNEFCAYYVELSKPALFGKKGEKEKSKKQCIALAVLFDAILILHPFAPYITEELFQLLKKRFASWTDRAYEITQGSPLKRFVFALSQKTLAEVSYPSLREKQYFSKEIENAFARTQEVIAQIRAIRGEMKIAPSQPIELYFKKSAEAAHNGSLFSLIHESRHIIEALIRVRAIQFVQDMPQFAVESRALVEDLEVVVPLPNEMKKQELARLEKELHKLLEQKARTEAQLKNQAFIEKAPRHLIAKLQETLQQQEQEYALMTQQQARLQREETVPS